MSRGIRALQGLAKRNHSKLVVVAVVLAIVGLVAAWWWSSGLERRALLEMPAEQRHLLYEDTLRATRAMCRSAESARALADQCDQSAELLLAFPECDGECAAFVRSVRSRAAR